MPIDWLMETTGTSKKRSEGCAYQDYYSRSMWVSDEHQQQHRLGDPDLGQRWRED
ncbi:hypothetical protein ITJ57_07025 [Plantibacter sp. VKM Ac-2880]|uniref:hypothetical protein n=1 Tax=Plantibacter sp. VKM Ac-2880 TaxID=2783827 RepID=UPI00188E9903|nr:hypothetical protein [Plantibacter sp. VKM Ac-2880]MBF4568521.1 hypothetical protein [Plantibacter sp. VKM Ac-2880]